MLTFAECTRAHLPAVRDFWAHTYGPSHVLGTDSELFQWQFGPLAGGRPQSAQQGAASDRYNMKLALDGDQVLGCLGFIPTDVAVGGTVLRGCWLANWMVNPERSRVGIGPLLLREVLRDTDIVVNVGISEAARALLVRMGWLDLHLLVRWVRPLKRGLADTLLPPDAGGEWPDAVPVALPAGFLLHSVLQFDEQAEALWDKVWGLDSAGTRRSAQLLNWRYATHPRFRYEMLELREQNRLVGFAVYRVEQVRGAETLVGRIVEIVAAASRAAALISAVCQHAADRGVAVLDFFCTSSRLHDDLVLQGFQRTDGGRAQHMPHLFQPLDRSRSGIACMISASSVALPRAANDWYVTKGDADQDRPN